MTTTIAATFNLEQTVAAAIRQAREEELTAIVAELYG
jgi:hypothetical protein